MSFVALKTFLLPPKRCHIKPHETKRMEGQQSGETESQDAVPIPPFTEKSSERSWLSCNSSIDIEDQKLSRSFLPQDSLPSTASIQNRSLLAKMKISPSPRMISDAIIGVSDGLTVPFALTAGLASFADTHIVILGGVAELVAGMISMGLGGLLGAQSEADGYRAKLAETTRSVQKAPQEAIAIIHDIFSSFGLPHDQRELVVANLMSSQEKSVDFIMRFHHQEKEPDAARPIVCALTIGLGYLIGGFVPLLPYLCVEKHQVLLALYISIGIMLFALFLFGWVKTLIVAEKDEEKKYRKAFIGAIQMVAVGGCAAAAAVGIVRGINHG